MLGVWQRPELPVPFSGACGARRRRRLPEGGARRLVAVVAVGTLLLRTVERPRRSGLTAAVLTGLFAASAAAPAPAGSAEKRSGKAAKKRENKPNEGERGRPGLLP